MAFSSRRVNVFKNGTNIEGICVAVPSKLETLLKIISEQMKLTAKKIYTSKGAVILTTDLIRDDESVFVSGGEQFIDINQSKDADKKNKHEFGVGSHFPTAAEQATSDSSDWIKLNVGGQYFITTRSTLVGNAQGSMLERMFSKDSDCPWSSTLDSQGAYLIDRTPQYFEPILNYLRHGQLVLNKNVSPAGVLEEAKFFGLMDLVEELEAVVKSELPPGDKSPITRREFALRLLHTPTETVLRCQGINFSNIDLSRMDLRHINFRYAIFRNANLTSANLTECNLERADMSYCTLDNAKLMGVRMLCVNLEGASMQNCYFEDPAGKQAYLEGANLKFVNLEGSSMVGVNLRVATLRKANLQNCDLRGAILAGADMEDADLTGSDLQEANLRGANLNGAYLELIVNPLHMSQTIPNR